MKQGTTYLRVKLKNLADEARTIRHEERKVRGADKQALQEHRKGIVRRAARSTALAYGFLRGTPYERIEPVVHTRPDFREVHRMVKKYGPPRNDGELEAWFLSRWSM